MRLLRSLPVSLLACCLSLCLSAQVRAADAAANQNEFEIGPEYADAPELAAKEGVPHGELHEFTMRSQESRIYPGIAKRQPGVVPYERKVWVYVPKQYVAGTKAPFIIVQDGGWYTKSMPTILDNLIHEQRIPVMVAIFANSGGGDAQGSQRGLEYDTVSGLYAEFVEKELLPQIGRAHV